jgi:hypothetical protein
VGQGQKRLGNSDPGCLFVLDKDEQGADGRGGV